MKNIDPDLGMCVRDKVTGYQGIVTVKTEMTNGCVQMGIQPQSKNNAMPDAHFIDIHLLEVVDEGVSRDIPPVDDTVTINLGEHVRDIVSNFEGITTEKVTYQNGCVYFIVQPKSSKKHELPESIKFPHQRLKRIGMGIYKKPAPQKPVRKPKDISGGPSRAINCIRSA